jgi:hypothetical protein
MEQPRDITERQEQSESPHEIEEFAERILAEPDYKKMVIAILRLSGKKVLPRAAGEALLQKLIGPTLQAKTIVTLFRCLQGAEYPGFCRDLFEASEILTALGAVEEGMNLFISYGLICFGGKGRDQGTRLEATSRAPIMRNFAR